MASVPPADRPMRLGLRPLSARSPLVRPRLGVVARRVSQFGRLVGVSGAVRRELRPGVGPVLEVVRLPDGVWPMPAAAEDPLSAELRADPGMAAIANLYRRRRAQPTAPVRRGLPSATRRGARSAAGPQTGP